MNILLANESLRLGGIETVSTELANGLADHQMTVSFCASPGELQHRLSPEVRYFPLPQWRWSNSLLIVKTLSEIIARTQPHILHCQSATVGILAAVAARRVTSRVTKVLTYHSRRFSRVPQRVGAALLRRGFDHYVAISDSKRHDLLNLGISPSQISVIPNMVDCRAIDAQLQAAKPDELYRTLAMDPSQPVITMAGRMVENKGFDTFIRIIAKAARLSKRPLVGLLLGDGPLRSDLEALAARYSDIATFHFLGFQKDIFRYLAITDLVLFTSHREVLPMFVIESIAAGRPVVGLDIPGNHDILTHGVNGFLVKDPENDDEYCQHVITLLQDSQLQEEMSQAAQKTALARFDRPAVIQNLVAMYHEVLP